MKWYDDLKIAGNLVCLVRNPNKTDVVFDIANTAIKRTEAPEVQHVVQKALLDQSFKELWQQKYLVNLPDLKKLILYPKDTLGFKYAAHMLQNNLNPNFYPFIAPSTLIQYLSLISRQTHDLWHVVTGYDTSIAGETALQAFYTAQTESALSASLVATGILHMAHKNALEIQSLFGQMSEGFERGRKAKFLLGVRWESYLETPLAKIRAEFGL